MKANLHQYRIGQASKRSSEEQGCRKIHTREQHEDQVEKASINKQDSVPKEDKHEQVKGEKGKAKGLSKRKMHEKSSQEDSLPLAR